MKPENLHAIVSTVVGSDEEAKKVIERTKTDEVKKLLSANTNQAFKDGAFGLPWFVGKFCVLCEVREHIELTESATNSKGETESFWGVDHVGQLCDHLGLDRPTGKGWRALL
tara:strand:- start:10168 stop:10503 length:336 start_codon:yes stop_codon:yes gene_type:complete